MPILVEVKDMVAAAQSGLESARENSIKELKIGFGIECVSSGQFAANSAFFRIGVTAHNLCVLFRHPVLGADWRRHRVATVRQRLFHLPGKMARHARIWVLKIPAGKVDLFRSIRERGFALAASIAP